MTRVRAADVAVVGGGPAGAVTALLLARAGMKVVLFERSSYESLRFGETLPPSVNPRLRELSLWDRFEALGSVPSYETASAWGDSEPAQRSFLFSPHGHGWHVDRARFDRMLAEAAEDAGARVLRGCRVHKVIRNGASLQLEGDEPACVGTIVDATGRAARVARSLGAERVQLDRLVCAARVFETGSEVSGDTFIEAEPNGWWYASPLPEGRRLIALFADATHAIRARLASVDGWESAIATTDHARALARGSPRGGVHMVSCASHELRPVAGAQWIAVGDAALAADPLSSGGVSFALRSAVAASEVLMGGDRCAYQGLVSAAASEYRQIRTQIYGWEKRFAESDFWRLRATRPAA